MDRFNLARTPVTGLKSGRRAFIDSSSVYFCRCKDATTMLTLHLTSPEADVKERHEFKVKLLSLCCYYTYGQALHAAGERRSNQTAEMSFLFGLKRSSTDEEPLHQEQLWSEQCFQIPPVFGHLR